MSYERLPENYVLRTVLDFKHNKKNVWLMNLTAVLVAAVLIVLGCLLVDPVGAFSECAKTSGYGMPFLWAALILVVLTAYLVLRTFVHGAFLYLFTRVRPKFGFSCGVFYCASPAYCEKQPYIIARILPALLWTVLFIALNLFFLHGIPFWFVWLLQCGNLSSMGGDMFVAFKIAQTPKNVLIFDEGLEISVFRPMTAGELLLKTEKQNAGTMSEEEASKEERS